MDWQPIETAPKDENEEPILICNGRYQSQQRVAYYELAADPKYPWHVEDAAEGFNHHKDWPTHWKLLDPPPPMDVKAANQE